MVLTTTPEYSVCIPWNRIVRAEKGGGNDLYICILQSSILSRHYFALMRMSTATYRVVFFSATLRSTFCITSYCQKVSKSNKHQRTMHTNKSVILVITIPTSSSKAREHPSRPIRVLFRLYPYGHAMDCGQTASVDA